MRRRDDLFESDPPEEKSTAEDPSEDFFFEEKEDEFSVSELQDELNEEPQDERNEELQSVESTVESTATKGGSRSRVPLLLLLLIGLLGAAYFFMGDLLSGPATPTQSAVVKSQPQKQKIPARKIQQEQKAVQEVVIPTEKVATAPAEENVVPQEKAAAAVETPAGKAVEPATEEPVEATQAVVESKSTMAVTPTKKTAMTEKEPIIPAVAEEPKVEEKTEAVAIPEKAPYVLQVGAYVLDSNMTRTLEVVKSLGYEPFVLEGKKAVTMTRLRVGTYPEKVAREKLSELQQVVPSAFLLHEGDQMVLYAGSYYGLNHARVQADLIYPHEIHVDEERVNITIPIKTVRFGDFKDSEAAGVMVEKAKAAGLDTLIVKQN